MNRWISSFALAMVGCSSSDTSADAGVKEAWERLATCLTGEVAPQEPTRLMRRAQLQAALDRKTGAEGWPFRCDARLQALRTALGEGSAGTLGPLREAVSRTEPLWSARPAGLPPQVDHAAVASLYAIASAALGSSEVATEVEKPALAEPIESRDVAAIHADELVGDAAPDGDLNLLTPNGLCTVRAATPEAMTCRDLAEPARKHGGRAVWLADSDDGEASPLVRVRSSLPNDEGFFDAFTGARARLPEGTFAALRRGAGIATLSLQRGAVLVGTGATPDGNAPVPPPRPLPGLRLASVMDAAAPVLVGEAVLWVARGHLFAVHLDGASEPTDLGPSEALAGTLRGCRQGDFSAVDLGNSTFAIHARGAWSLASDGDSRQPTFNGRLSCTATAVSLVEIVSPESNTVQNTLKELRCEPSRCSSATLELGDLGPRHGSDAPVAVRVADRIVLAFRRASPDFSDAGVLVRVAPLDELARAPERVAFDPGGHQPSRIGLELERVELDLRARGSNAFLFVRRQNEWAPIRITADGTLAAVRQAARP